MLTSTYLRIYDTYLLQSRLVMTVQRLFSFSLHFISRSIVQRGGQSRTGCSFYGFVCAHLLPLSLALNLCCTDQIVLSVIWGSMLGYSFRHLMKFCERKDLIDRQSYVAQYISLALLTVGTTTLLGTEVLLASFTCGTAFSWDGFFNKQTEASVFSSVVDLLLNTAAFVYVGAWMPFDSFSDPTLSLSIWRLICIAILILMLRRLPIILGLFKWIPDIKSFREALFCGHFGPIGIGDLHFSLFHTIAHVIF